MNLRRMDMRRINLDRVNWPRLQTILRRISRPVAAVLFLTLPVTSFPYFPPAMGGEALVRPLALYPLVILIFTSLLPRLFVRPVSRTLSTLVPFVLVAAVSSALSLLQGIEPALGISVESRVLRGMLTLLIGCAFYVVIADYPDTQDDLSFALRWMYAGGALALLWGSLQAAVFLLQRPDWFALLNRLQAYISIRPLRADRISGLTYEPHWFAEQIILLLLPWSLAAVLANTTLFRWRRGRLTVELLLVAWSLLVLPFTFSRAGLANLVVMAFLTVLFFRPLPVEAVTARVSPRRWLALPQVRRRFLEVVLTVVVVAAPIYLIGTQNLFFARIWDYWKQPNPTFTGYMTYLGFDARLVYSQAALNTYLAHPVLGVGLGNYAFYFEEMLPYRPIAQVPEVLLMITPEAGRDRLITAKNFPLRLLAETGIVGTVCFMAFLTAILGCAIYMWLDPRREWQYWGMASLCGLLAFALASLTFDSFVIPNMWVIFGLISAATRVMIQTSAKEPVDRSGSLSIDDVLPQNIPIAHG